MIAVAPISAEPAPGDGTRHRLSGRFKEAQMEDRLPTLLCVDDDPEIVRILEEYFTQQGFVVHTATNGVEALLRVKQYTPKAVILNLSMPKLGGLAALEAVRSLAPGSWSS